MCNLRRVAVTMENLHGSIRRGLALSRWPRTTGGPSALEISRSRTWSSPSPRFASLLGFDRPRLGIGREVDDERFTLVGDDAAIGEGAEHGRADLAASRASRPSGSRLTSSGLPSAQTFVSAISATRSASPNSGESPNDSRTAADVGPPCPSETRVRGPCADGRDHACDATTPKNHVLTHRIHFSIRVRADDLAARDSGDGLPGGDVDRVLDEVDAAVDEQDVDAARMTAPRRPPAVIGPRRQS